MAGRTGPGTTDRQSLIPPVLAVVAALLVRLTPWPTVFTADGVSLRGQDAWYHLRAIEHLVRNFPHRLTEDPYAAPDGQYIPLAPFFDQVVAGFAWLAGGGTPSERLIETTAALMPPVLGAITVALIYLLGRRLFDHRTGSLAAGLAAIMPSQFLERTVLGFADHHAMEVALATAALLALVVSLEAVRTGGRDARAALWSAVTGAALGAYLLCWASGAFLVFALLLWLWLQASIDQWHRQEGSYSLVILPLAATAMACVLAVQSPLIPGYDLQVGSLLLLALSSAGLDGMRWAVQRWTLPRFTFHAVAGAVVLLAIAALSAWAPAEVEELRVLSARLWTAGARSSVIETQPLLLLQGTWTLETAWLGFRTAFFVGVPALGVLAVRAARGGSRSQLLLVVWTAVTLVATLGQNRFGYYLGPNLALLTGWAASALLGTASLGRVSARRGAPTPRRAAVAVVVVAGVIFAPHLRAGIDTGRVPSGQSPAWRSALEWMRANTPEPFETADYYLTRYNADGVRLPSYTVMNWWDYGYWIMRTARRVPAANPTQTGAGRSGHFFASTDQRDAAVLLGDIRGRYVLVDDRLPMGVEGGGLFEVILRWAGLDPSRFYGNYLERRADGELVPVRLIHPDYYRTVVVRLTLFDARAAPATDLPWVVAFDSRANPGGALPVVTGGRTFPTYEEARRYVAAQLPGTHRVVCRDPTRPCLPIDALEDYHLVYGGASPAGPRAPVRIFEYRSTVP